MNKDLSALLDPRVKPEDDIKKVPEDDIKKAPEDDRGVAARMTGRWGMTGKDDSGNDINFMLFLRKKIKKCIFFEKIKKKTLQI